MARKKQRNHPQTRQAAQAAQKKRRRRRHTGKKTIHYILLVVFVLSVGAVLSLTTFFKIQAVTVLGTDKYLPEEIVKASGIELEENLFRIPAKEIAERLETEFPYIESAQVHRRLPPAIEIEVVQASPEAAVMEGDEVVLITRDGKVLERGIILIPPDVPVVRGIETRDAKPGEMLGEESQEGLKMLQNLMNAIDSVGFEHITNVDISNRLSMFVVYENRLLLKLGVESDLEHKLVFIKKALEDMDPEQEGRIDVSDAKSKRKLVFKDISLEEALALEEKERAYLEKADQLEKEDEPSEMEEGSEKEGEEKE